MVRAVAMLQRNPLWNEIDKLFASELAKTFESMSEAPSEVVLRQCQGIAQLIKEFQRFVQDAPVAMTSLASHDSKTS